MLLLLFVNKCSLELCVKNLLYTLVWNLCLVHLLCDFFFFAVNLSLSFGSGSTADIITRSREVKISYICMLFQKGEYHNEYRGCFFFCFVNSFDSFDF